MSSALRFSGRVLLAALLLGLFASAAAGAPAVTPRAAVAPAATHTIVFPVNGLNYSPNDLTIFTGDTVAWSGPFAFHPLVSEDDLWTVVDTGDSFQHTFTQPGVYRYYCQVHGAPGGVGMSGVIRVVEAGRSYLPAVLR